MKHCRSEHLRVKQTSRFKRHCSSYEVGVVAVAQRRIGREVTKVGKGVWKGVYIKKKKLEMGIKKEFFYEVRFLYVSFVSVKSSILCLKICY